jgi:hypothetical protein
MEDVLDVYAAEHSDDEPLVCMDEASKQLLKDLTEPIPMASGRPKREDYHYGRRGTQAIFCFFDPIRGWRRMAVEDSRTAVDWAEQIRILLEVDYPKARKVKLVCDNLPGRTGAGVGDAIGDPLHAGSRELAERGGDRAERSGEAVSGSANRLVRRVEGRGGEVGGGAERNEEQSRVAVHDGGRPSETPPPLPTI